MKPRLLVMIFALSSFATYAQYTAIPDPNFEQALIDLGIDSEGTLDGQVLTADIISVTTLSIPSKGITNLNGIEGFTSLERLICNQNSLSTLDLSNNMALTEVYCYFNSLTSLTLPNTNTITQIEFYNNQLTSIDLTPYTNLTFLRSYNNPSLGSFDISNCPSLEYLYCQNNGLNSLDITQNPNLLILDCYQNNLSVLDVSNNTLLTRLWCHQNNLTNLDVTQNPNLTTLYCHINQIQNLDITNNTQLTRLWCNSNQLNTLLLPVSNTLTDFRCYTNNLTALDVSGLSALDYLDCGINSITSLDVSMVSTITQLYCNDNQLTSLNLQNNNLTYLWAQNNSSLNCIQVDDVTVANSKTTAGDWQKDAGASYNTTCALGIEDFNESRLALFPNPAKNKFTIDIDRDAKYSLISTQGQALRTGTLLSGINEMDIRSLSNGLYFLTIETAEGKATKKLIKE